MSPVLSIRPPTAADAGRLAEVHVRCWQEAYHGILSDGFLAALEPAGRLPLWTQLLADPPAGSLWAAYDGGTAVGFAGVRPVPSTAGVEPPAADRELWGLYLLASHHGLGLGGRLLRAALGTDAASLWVASENTRAIGFYRHFGFRADGAADLVPEWENLAEMRMVRPGQAGISG